MEIRTRPQEARRRVSVWDEVARDARTFAVPLPIHDLFTSWSLDLLIALRVPFLKVVQVALSIQPDFHELYDPWDLSYVMSRLGALIPELDNDFAAIESLGEDVLRFIQHFDRYLPAKLLAEMARGKQARAMSYSYDTLLVEVEPL